MSLKTKFARAVIVSGFAGLRDLTKVVGAFEPPKRNDSRTNSLR